MIYAVRAGLAVGLMHATKETAVLAWAAMAGALILTFLVRGRRGIPRVRVRDVVAGLVAAAAVSMLFFSSFLTNPRGILDSVLTYVSYLDRAGGAGPHEHPWYFYLSLFAYTKRPFGPRWSEGLILGLAVVGSVAAFTSPGRSDRRFLRFLAFYTLLLTAVYALIPYKTPWSALSFFHGMILLAGVGAAALVRWARYLPLRIAVAVLLGLGAWQLGMQAYRASYEYPADYRNPYAYAHPTSNVIRLAERMEALAAASPLGHDLVVKVLAPGGDYWPLPWYLRHFNRVGYWDRVPTDADTDVIIANRAFEPELEPKLRQSYHMDYFGLRADILLLVYTRQDLWDAFLKTRQGYGQAAGGDR